ncbi:NUDIX hydrolase [Mangrovactinospora gilvigrisea]|uniref:NUDIX hydrolase n=1 Tax=Mangrovactinospora gilvigrisea TaxID=1428644 RepID=A0A1J7BEY4_9ACTN|nr:NUDIX hydrolase [Mangrovactinospora gilvigrisea]OIV37198.1 NUDIX hydrolase [Mangrovactinospora gilvigrisea]
MVTSLHGDAVRVLTEWDAPDDRQHGLREEYLAHLAAHPGGMYRENPGAHLTASALVVSAEGDRVLLTLHRKLRMWLQTGGHCEPADATLAGAALREAVEESGIPGLALRAPAPLVLDAHQVPRCGRHLDAQYVAVAPPGAEPAVSEESVDVRWFPADALPSDTDDSVRRLVEAAVARPSA